MYTLLLIVAVAYLALCVALYLGQRRLIYHPQPASGADAARVTLPVPGECVVASVISHHGPRALIYFGGNAEDVTRNVPGFAAALADQAAYLLHYRGYGGSSGRPTEAALFADALALFDLVHAKHTQVEVVGRSLGSGIAVYVASRRPVEGLVLVTPFDSLAEVAAAGFPAFPVKWLLRDQYNSWIYAPAVNAPTLIIAADQDEVVPRRSTEMLRSRFKNGLVSMRVLPGTGHNSIQNSPQYFPLLSWQHEELR